MRPMSEILADALVSFEDGKNWMRGTLYPGSDKLPAYTKDAEFVKLATSAEKFCAYGAIFKSMVKHGELDHNPFARGDYTEASLPGKIEMIVRGALPQSNQVKSITSVNDRAASFDEVKQMFCRGIKRALEIEKSQEEPNNVQ